ncbi:MAG: hypothetical protein JWO80_4980 [Bryobacterales bacterium]|nr:hypothetical protein [Bryobacterales bacterium]
MKHSLPLLFLSATALAAQTRTLTCDQNDWGNQATHCEIQEQNLASSGKITVDGRTNGGISIKSWGNAGVLVRAKVQASGDTEGAARATYSQVIVHTTGGVVSADGPAAGHWSVSYEIFVPSRTDLNLTAHNGGISISGVEGNLEFQTTNGGIHLSKVSGNVHGRTQNGGVHVELAGARWNGTGLDVQSQNGGVHLDVPANYSAHLETSTVNGGIHSELPQLIQNSRQRELRVDLGSGGPTLRVTTTNGGVHIGRSDPAAI